MAAAVEAWRLNQAALAELALDPRELARRLELQEHQAAEIAGARLRVGEAAEIRAGSSSAQHAEAIARGSGEIHDAARRGGDRRAGDRRPRRPSAPATWRGSTSATSQLAERLLGLAAELEDAAAEARGAGGERRARPGGAGRGWRSGCRSSTRSSASTARTRRR